MAKLRARAVLASEPQTIGSIKHINENTHMYMHHGSLRRSMPINDSLGLGCLQRYDTRWGL